MANNAFATSKQAADVVGITPQDIGVSANHFVCKKHLIATGKFDAEPLSAYKNNQFILLKDLVTGTALISISLSSDSASRGTIQINGGTAGSSASVDMILGNEVILKCNLNNPGDVFDGWYEGSTRVSTNLIYSFTCAGARNLVAKILYIDVSTYNLDFTNSSGSAKIVVNSNTNWSLS